MRARFTAISLALVLSGCVLAAEYGVPEGPKEGGTVELFYDALVPYGTWLDSPVYGWMWVPSAAVVGPGFVPYATAGHWVPTTVGWMFLSDWEWGWAPFHFGRWCVEPDYGWAWVPDSIWAPAWVDWRFGGGLVGWAPMPPQWGGLEMTLASHWVFVQAADFDRPDVAYHLLAPGHELFERAGRVRTRVDEGAAYWYVGPPVDEIDRFTGRRTELVAVSPPRAGALVRMRVEGGAVRALPVHAPRWTTARIPPQRTTVPPGASSERTVPGEVYAPPMGGGPDHRPPKNRRSGHPH